MKIIVDPGHGGNDLGIVGNCSKESDINLEISKIIYVILNYENYNVKLTRKDDNYIYLEDRVVSEVEDIFISIHCNATASKEPNGIETFYYPGSEQGKELANLIQFNLIESTKRRDRGIKNRNLYVLKETICPAVLVECGFLSNEKEEWLLNIFYYQIKVAKAIATGIKKYLN